jgi:hypothetical protein
MLSTRESSLGDDKRPSAMCCCSITLSISRNDLKENINQKNEKLFADRNPICGQLCLIFRCIIFSSSRGKQSIHLQSSMFKVKALLDFCLPEIW